MNRFLYDGGGRQLSNVEDLLGMVDDGAKKEIETALEVESLGIGSRLDKIYIPLATAVMGRLKVDGLRKRTLASGLMLFYVDRSVVFEPGIEAMSSEVTPIANNYNDLTIAPENVHPFSQDHMLWIAQSLLDFDFGVQHERLEQQKLAQSLLPAAN